MEYKPSRQEAKHIVMKHIQNLSYRARADREVSHETWLKLAARPRGGLNKKVKRAGLQPHPLRKADRSWIASG